VAVAQREKSGVLALGYIIFYSLAYTNWCPYFCSPVAAILWGSWCPDPSLSGNLRVQMCTDPSPYFSVPFCYRAYMACNPSADSWLNSACTLISVVQNINVDLIRLFDCINYVQNQNVWQWARSSCPNPRGVHEKEGKKRRLKEGEKWPGPPDL